MEAALERWPFYTGKQITKPFAGIGVRCPDPEMETETDEEYEKAKENAYKLEDELPAFSQSFPDMTFVFVCANCFGGTCIYSGYIVRNGQLELELDDINKANLKQLMRPLGIGLFWSGHFEPFVRGFWRNSNN